MTTTVPSGSCVVPGPWSTVPPSQSHASAIQTALRIHWPMYAQCGLDSRRVGLGWRDRAPRAWNHARPGWDRGGHAMSPGPDLRRAHYVSVNRAHRSMLQVRTDAIPRGWATLQDRGSRNRRQYLQPDSGTTGLYLL